MKTVLRWLTRLVLSIVGLILILGVLGAIYQALASSADQQNFPPPGELVDVGGYKMHIYCMGEGSPTVILDSANMGTVSNWDWIQPELARTTHVCAYDRADAGWSNISPQPNDTQENAKALHALLAAADVSGPYVLVGHSLGGLYVRMYAEMYSSKGLCLMG